MERLPPRLRASAVRKTSAVLAGGIGLAYTRPMRFGADRLAAEPRLLAAVLGRAPRRLALLTNDAVRLASDPERRTRTALLEAGLPLVRLFSPEHGLGAAAPDGAAVGDATDPLTGLPVTSLYGESLRPAPEVLAGLDAVLGDLPDIGVRCYTYAWTLTHVIDACAAAGVPVVVLDRPNPLGAALASAEGPLLEPAHASFLGRFPVPLRHALTLGELALLWQREQCPATDVRVLECEGWARDRPWPETGLPFVPTSPAIHRFEAALLYAGTCLFEATNLSVGRGTPLAFEAVGAPWLRATSLLERLGRRHLPGLSTEPARFTPATGPWAGDECHAVRLVVQEARRVRPVAAGLALLAEVAALHPGELRWATYPTAANPSGAGHLERLAGTAAVGAAIETDPRAVDDDVVARWTAVPGWGRRWETARLYD